MLCHKYVRLIPLCSNKTRNSPLRGLWATHSSTVFEVSTCQSVCRVVTFPLYLLPCDPDPASYTETICQLLEITLYCRLFQNAQKVWCLGIVEFQTVHRVPPCILTYTIQSPREESVWLVLLLAEHTNY
jgi:hypothetical protein